MVEAYADRPAWPGPDPEPWWYRDCSPWLAAWRVRQMRAQRYNSPLERKNRRDRTRAPLYVRFGDLPDNGASSTWRRMWRSTGRRENARLLAGDFEAGVSCFRGRRVEGGYEVLPGSVDQAAMFRTLKRQERPAYLVEGEEIGVGAGFEPVLKDARIVGRIDPGEVVMTGFWADVGSLFGAPLAPLSVLEGSNAAALLNEVLTRSTGKDSTLHGEEHWRRVAAAGAFLCERTPGANPAVVFLFSLFHDAMRRNDGEDPGHGGRGAALASALLQEGFYKLPEAGAGRLREACERHDTGEASGDPIIGTCWDADRLNLWRVGVRPDPALLSTAAARDPMMVERCKELQDEPVPSWGALDEWYGMIRAEGSRP